MLDDIIDLRLVFLNINVLVFNMVLKA